MKRVGFRWIARGSCRHPEGMTLRGGSLCAATFPAMVGVIEHPEAGTLLFDTGYDAAFLQATHQWPERLYRLATPVELADGGDWMSWLTRHGVSPGEIRGVIVSHFHGDHVAGLRGLPGVPVWCARAGLERVWSGSRLQRVFQGLLEGLIPRDIGPRARFFEDAAAAALPPAFAPVSEGRDLLGDGSLIAVELPGHCPGHWGLALRTREDRHVLLAADAAWSARAIATCTPPPRITTAFLGQTRPYRETLARLHQAHARNPDLAILPSHCAESAATFRRQR